MRLTDNFTLAEFERVSYRGLTQAEVSRALIHANALQLVRDAVNRDFPRDDGRKWRVRITSYLRPHDGSDHANGAAVDWVVSDPANGMRSDRLTKWGRDWLAVYHAPRFDRLLWELDHVHHALDGMSRKAVPGPAIVLDQVGEDDEGKPLFSAAILPSLDTGLKLGVVLAAGVGAYILAKNGL